MPRLASARVLTTRFSSLSNMKIGVSRAQNSRMLFWSLSLMESEGESKGRSREEERGEGTLYNCLHMPHGDAFQTTQSVSAPLTRNKEIGGMEREELLPGGVISVATAKALKRL